MAESASVALDEDSVSGSDKEATRWSSLLAKFSILPLFVLLIEMAWECGNCAPFFSSCALTRACDWNSQLKLLINMESRVP